MCAYPFKHTLHTYTAHTLNVSTSLLSNNTYNFYAHPIQNSYLNTIHEPNSVLNSFPLPWPSLPSHPWLHPIYPWCVTHHLHIPGNWVRKIMFETWIVGGCLVGDSKERSGKCNGLFFRGPETGPNCTTSEAKEGSTHLSCIWRVDGVKEQLFLLLVIITMHCWHV